VSNNWLLTNRESMINSSPSPSQTSRRLSSGVRTRKFDDSTPDIGYRTAPHYPDTPQIYRTSKGYGVYPTKILNEAPEAVGTTFCRPSGSCCSCSGFKCSALPSPGSRRCRREGHNFSTVTRPGFAPMDWSSKHRSTHGAHHCLI
jgi:hypothetical protein